MTRYEISRNLMMKVFISIILMMILTGPALAGQRITLGAKLLGAGWKGEDAGARSFESDNGGQFGLNVAYSNDKFYTGLNLQRGEYTFNSTAPDQFRTGTRVPTNNTTIKQSDFDLLAGYYFWDQVSLFADIKSVRNDWLDDNYQQTFTGLGLGATGFTPLAPQWTLYGSIGFIGGGEIKDGNDDKAGEGTSWAFEIGSVYAINDQHYLSAGLKTRSYAFEYLDKTKQDYAINAIFFGYSYNIDLK